jgi:hypothetical protein
MKTDAYTRIVLTVLACTLIVFVIHVFGSEAVYGQRPGGAQIVYICDPRVQAKGETWGPVGTGRSQQEYFCLRIEKGSLVGEETSSQGNT